MRPDLATIYLSQFCTFALVTFGVLAIGLRYPRELALKLWGSAGVSATIGVFLILLRGTLPGWVSVELGNLLIFCSLALTWLGARAFEQRSLPWATAIALVVAAFTVLILIGNAPRFFEWRSLLYSTTYLVFHGLTLSTLLGSPSRHRAGYRFVTGLIILLMASHVFRLYISATAEAGTLATSMTLALHNFASTLLEMAKFLGFVFIFIEKLEHKLHRLAMRDELTGLYNRRAFYRQAAQELARAPSSPPALLVMDLDLFKQVNDTHGHLTGDRVLQAFGDVLRQVMQPYDGIYARTGGEEFVVLLTGDTAAHAGRIAETLRQRCQALILFSEDGQPIGQTVSIGLCHGGPGHHDLRQLFQHADQALYRAKEHGRNQVCRHDSGPASDVANADNPPRQASTPAAP